MKYKKYISLLLVTVLLLASVSMITSARVTGFKAIKALSDGDVNDTGTIETFYFSTADIKERCIINGDEGHYVMGKLFKKYFPVNMDEFEEFRIQGLEVSFTAKVAIKDIFSRDGIRSILFLRALPIRLITMERIEIEPELELTLKMENSMPVGEPIPVVAILTNKGKEVVDVSEMDLELGTLDFIITTPDGQILCYNNSRYIRRLPGIETIQPGDSIIYETDDITVQGMFVNKIKKDYEFIEGEYTIQGKYESGLYNTALDGDSIVTCEVYSERYGFGIYVEEETFELMLEADPLDLTMHVFKLAPAPIDYGAQLDGKIHASYAIGTKVSITVVEKYEDLIFEQWSGDASGNSLTVELQMDSNKKMIGHFKDHQGPLAPKACFIFTPSNPLVFETVTFDGTCSSDLDGKIVAYYWSIQKYDFNFLNQEESIAEVVFEEAGVYVVSLTVVDNDGLNNTVTKDIVVKDEQPPENEPPVADFIVNPKTLLVGKPVLFEDRSTDEDGEVVEWLWDFGDGSEGSKEKNPECKYEKPGIYMVTLVVTDDDGDSDEESKTIEVNDFDPEPGEAIIFGTVKESPFRLGLLYLPVPDAKVEAYSRMSSNTEELAKTTCTDKEGRYKLELEPGEYRIVVTKRGYKPAGEKVGLKSGEEKEVNFILVNNIIFG